MKICTHVNMCKYYVYIYTYTYIRSSRWALIDPNTFKPYYRCTGKLSYVTQATTALQPDSMWSIKMSSFAVLIVWAKSQAATYYDAVLVSAAY